jgi:hypothetical protein
MSLAPEIDISISSISLLIITLVGMIISSLLGRRIAKKQIKEDKELIQWLLDMHYKYKKSRIMFFHKGKWKIIEDPVRE